MRLDRLGEPSQHEPQHGLQLVRYAELPEFTCSHSGGRTRSKLVADRFSEPDKPVCSGYYGFLLSKSFRQ